MVMAIEEHIDEFALNKVQQFGNIFYVKGFLLVNESYVNDVKNPTTAGTEISVVFDVNIDRSTKQGVFNTVLGVGELPGNPWEFDCYFVVPDNKELSDVAIRLTQPSVYDGEFDWNKANEISLWGYETNDILPFNDEVVVKSITVPEQLPRGETLDINYKLENVADAPIVVRPKVKIGGEVVSGDEPLLLGGGLKRPWFPKFADKPTANVKDEIEVPKEVGVENLCIDTGPHSLPDIDVPEERGAVVDIN